MTKMDKNRICETCKYYYTDSLYTLCLNMRVEEPSIGPESTCRLHEFENELDYLIKPNEITVINTQKTE